MSLPVKKMPSELEVKKMPSELDKSIRTLVNYEYELTRTSERFAAACPVRRVKYFIKGNIIKCLIDQNQQELLIKNSTFALIKNNTFATIQNN